MTFDLCKEVGKDVLAELIDYSRELGLTWTFGKVVTLERSDLLLKIHQELKKIIGEQTGLKPEELILDGYMPGESPRNYEISLLRVVGCRKTPFYSLGLNFDEKSGLEIAEFGFHTGTATDRKSRKTFLEVRNSRQVKMRERTDQLSDKYHIYSIHVDTLDCLKDERERVREVNRLLYDRLKESP